MKEEFAYKSTSDGKPPSGRKKAGTWKDISLVGAAPKLIDEYDTECVEKGLSRKELFNELLSHPDLGGDTVRFYEIFSKVNKFKKFAEDVKNRNCFGEFTETKESDSTLDI